VFNVSYCGVSAVGPCCSSHGLLSNPLILCKNAVGVSTEAIQTSCQMFGLQRLFCAPSLVLPVCVLSHQSFAVSVNFVAASGAFPAGFTPTSGTATFPAGQTSQTLPFTWECDSTDNDDRVVTITLSNPTSPLTVSAINGSATLAVLDDDAVRFAGCRGVRVRVRVRVRASSRRKRVAVKGEWA
jgi:hypothetical protein